MPPKSIHWPSVAVCGIFIVCACACLLVFFTPSDETVSSKIGMNISLLTLAGLVISFIDRHQRSQTTNQKIDENTAATNQAPAVVIDELKNGVGDSIAKKTALAVKAETAKVVKDVVKEAVKGQPSS